MHRKGEPVLPHFVWENITFGDWDELPEVSVVSRCNIMVSFTDIFLARDGAHPDPSNPRFERGLIITTDTYLPKTKVRKQKNLLGGSVDEQAEQGLKKTRAGHYVSHWHKNLTLALVSDGSRRYPPERDETEFWHLRSQYIEINTTTPTLLCNYWKFTIFATLTDSFAQAASAGCDGCRMLVETNPCILHVLFEFLAFSSDVSHWRKKESLWSWKVCISRGCLWTLLTRLFKITKAVDIAIRPAPAGSLLPYKLEITDKHVLSEDEKKTQEYDKLAFRYVSYVTIPCLAGYTAYSLLYETIADGGPIHHSIADLRYPERGPHALKAMIYKTLSTVVDDLFAFCIKMPILHRLACFRDDVVFLVFLYQRWIYRIDPKRVNEYGQVMASDADAVTEKEVDKKDPESKKNK
ncbi:cleft lip and palate transmembrane protein 1-domain-containing protein [Irpex lacteus]|nr:cleft lip and palate transmembrane protein 1-domain-containing protein [Irpex lacteus]